MWLNWHISQPLTWSWIGLFKRSKKSFNWCMVNIKRQTQKNTERQRDPWPWRSGLLLLRKVRYFRYFRYSFQRSSVCEYRMTAVSELTSVNGRRKGLNTSSGTRLLYIHWLFHHSSFLMLSSRISHCDLHFKIFLLQACLHLNGQRCKKQQIKRLPRSSGSRENKRTCLFAIN